MSYEVIARKWRPRIFQDVLGQEHITQTLINAIITERLAHAYLFSGARGVGKTSVARILAKVINCQKETAGNPCNECNSCRDITDGSSVDVQEIDGASNRGIDEIRELRENIKYMPSSGKYRVYIIDEVHMLTIQAFNALLKTLEEPPPHVKFIFATTEPHKVPVTILSRCQRFDFKRIPQGLIIKQLEKITAQEGIDIKRTGLAILAREAEGSMRDAESLLDQVASYTGSKVEDKNITDILGIIDRDLIFEISGAIVKGLSGRCIEIVEKIYNYGYDIKEFYRALLDQFRNLMVCLISSHDDLLDMTDEDRKELKAQAEAAGLEKIQQSLNILIAREEALKYSSHPRLVLETIIIKLCQLGDFLSVEDLLNRIETLEKGLISSGAVYDTSEESGRISEPDTTWKNEEAKVTEKKDKPKGQSWEEFLSYLSGKNRAMYNVLGEWNLKSFSESMVQIERGDNSFSSTYLDDPERLNKLLDYCRDFFKREIDIKIIGKKFKNKTSKKIDPGKKSNSKGGKPSELPQYVQNVLNIFDGEVKEEINMNKKEKNE